MAWQSAFFQVALVASVLLSTAGESGSTADNGPERSSPRSRENRADADLGINLDGLTDWGRAWMFVDVFKQSRPWTAARPHGSPPTPAGPLSVDDGGTVTSLRESQSAVTYIFTDSEGHYPAGRYVARYRGDGDLRWWGDAVVVSAMPGLILLDVVPEKGIRVEITRTDPEDPIRDIRLHMPGFGDGDDDPRFHPTFIERLRQFSVVRFMDLQRTNDSTLSSWEDRPRTSDSTQASQKGVALEHLMELVQILDIDPWFCMPHMADDRFVRRFAEEVRNHLPPGRRVYVEYSNEVWNGLFEQAQYARRQGLELGLSADGSEAQRRFQAQRSVEIFRIWESVFGGSDRLVRVISSQFANPKAIEATLDWREAYKSTDALAVAPYFGQRVGALDAAARVDGASPERLIEMLSVEVSALLPRIESTVRVAESRGLRLIAYEAGQHLVGRQGRQNDQALTTLFHATNRSAGMKGLYRQYLMGWKQAGGGLMMLFSFVSKPSKWGSWGMLEWQDQPPRLAPKWDAALELLEHGSRHPR